MEKGFFGSLFDVSFDSLVTTKIVKVVYVLYMVAIALLALGFIVSAFAASTVSGVLVLLIGAPLGSLIYLIFARVFLEAIIALFRIMENTQQLVAQGLPGSSPAGPTLATPAAPAPPAGPQAPGPSPPTP